MLPDIQYVADQLLDLGVIRKSVDVSEHVWTRPTVTASARVP